MSDDLPSKVADLLEKQSESLAAELQTLDELSVRARVAALEAEPFDVKLSSHVAWVAAQRAGIITHLRQLEKHNRVQSRTPEQRFDLVKSYIRNELDPPRRAELAALLVELEQSQRVLS